MANRTKLTLFASGRPEQSDYRCLTPRTPHSRSGRAEEAVSDPDDDDSVAFAAWRQQQTEPLLVSSASEGFPAHGYRSRGDDTNATSSRSSWRRHFTPRAIMDNGPLILGSVVAGILFSLIVVSYQSPEKLDELVGYHRPPAEDVVVAPTGQLPFAHDAGVHSPDKTVAPAPIPTPTLFVDTVPPPGHRISYENYTVFPLTGAQYDHECDKMMGGGKFMHHQGYWAAPEHGIMDVPHHDDMTDYHLPEGERTTVCTSTITYQLDGHVGLVADLALMAQAAALARERNRTFLVDDRYWNRGKWTDHFQDIRARQPGPEPGCRAPPSNELVACPRHARHWLINSRTAKYHFGHEFEEQYENAYKQQINRQRPIFESSLRSFIETIRPNAHNALLIRAARSELASVLSMPQHPLDARNDDIRAISAGDVEDAVREHHPDPYIAVHIRRGDRHASTFPYRGKYVPMENFISAAFATWDRLYNATELSRHSVRAMEHFPAPPIAWVASDSHEVAEEFMSGLPSSSAVFSLASSTNAELRALVPPEEYVQHEFDKMGEAERVRLTRGMVVDLAMLSGLWAWEGDVVPGATICTLSSTVCKVAALGLGFERAFGFDDNQNHDDGWINDARKRWVDLDGRGVVSPFWSAFEIFP